MGLEMRVEHTKDATQQNIEMKGSTQQDFARIDKSIIANILLSTNLERFLRRIKSSLTL